MNKYEVVIPTTADDVLTLESIPDEVTVHLEREGTLNEARNRGLSKVEAPIAIVMDDDLAFPPDLLDELAARANEDTLLGLADWDYGWIAGRMMVFPTSLWEDVGGFDERLGSHMGDTKFAIDSLRHGYELERIPRELLYHEPHSRDISTWDRAWRGLYLAAKHPTLGPKLAKGMVGR